MIVPDDEYWLALTVFLEAAGEPPEGQRAVAWVICNRQRARVGWTIADIVLLPAQFSCYSTMAPVRRRIGTAHEQPDWAACVAAATAAYEAMDEADDPTHGATHYLRTDTIPKPSWFDPSRVVATIGHHTFLKLP